MSFLRANLFACAALVAGLLSSCAASNFDFGAIRTLDDKDRGGRLSTGLTEARAEATHEDLYDLNVIPLVHSSLHHFAESDDDDYPGGFVETDVDATLPLFGFVDATVRRYDANMRPYERHDHDSYLWGLFRTHREQVATESGLREQREITLLWLFDWTSSPKYTAHDGDGAE